MFRRLSVVSSLALVVLAAGCSSAFDTDRTEKWSPQRLYTEAMDELNSGAYERAIPLFEKLEGRAAGTPLAQQAQLERAYAYYKQNEPAQAVATLDRFIKLHPASPALDYAYYLKGIVNFNDNLGMLAFIASQDLSERDQKAAKESFDAFRELITRFPDSKYAADARARMVYIVNSLAQYEVHVARYYYRRGAYVAAVNRAQLALSEYQNAPAQEEALFLLWRSYDALGLAQLRDDSRRLLEKNFPQSTYLTTGRGPSRSGPWWKIW